MVVRRWVSWQCFAWWLVAVPAISSAEWIPLLDNEKGRAFVAAERQPVAAGVVRLQGLQEPQVPFAMPQGSVRSVKSVEEFDCAGQRSRMIHLDFRDETGGKGASLTSMEQAAEWREVAGPFNEAMWRYACQPSAAERTTAR